MLLVIVAVVILAVLVVIIVELADIGKQGLVDQLEGSSRECKYFN